MTKEKETYNGWTNYATWRINLEILDGWADYHTEEKDFETFESIGELADHLKDYAENAIESEFEGDKQPSLAYSYALAFMSEVNYREIAQHIADDYPRLLKMNQTTTV